MLMDMLMDMKQLVPKKNTPAESTSPIVKEKSPPNKWIRNRFLYKRFSQFLFKFFKSLVGMQDDNSESHSTSCYVLELLDT